MDAYEILETENRRLEADNAKLLIQIDALNQAITALTTEASAANAVEAPAVAEIVAPANTDPLQPSGNE